MTSNPQFKPESNHFFQNFALGGLAAALSRTMVTPIEQIRFSLFCIAREVTESHWQAILRIRRDFGLSAFWAGNWRNVRRHSPVMALNFSLKETFKKFFSSSDPNTQFWKLFLGNLASGGAAGATSVLVVYPIDVARNKLAYESKMNPKSSELTDCLKSIYQKDGFRGLYKGFCTSLLSVAIYRAVYFGGYDTAKTAVFSESKKPNLISEYLVAQGITIISQFASSPIDTVRRRVVYNPKFKEKGMIDCIQKIYKEEGWRAFWKGARLNIVTNIGPAITLVLYDELQWMMYEKKLKN